MKNNTVDKDWNSIFEKYKVLEAIDNRGICSISAKQIQEFHEPRLMVKHDHSINRPKVFRDNDLAILPVTRGDYVIAKMELYQSFIEGKELLFTEKDVITVNPPDIESIDFKHINSEAIAINSIYACGILSSFLEEERLLPTVCGRMGSGCFDFNVNQYRTESSFRFSVNNSQIEIDGGFEGDNCLCLIEAKNSLSDDFLIRQLYYPYRVWREKVAKSVRPVFLCYSNGIYHLLEYKFDDPNNYNSIVLVKYSKYQIREEESLIVLDDLSDLLNKTQIIKEPEIPFPQANSILRVIDLCEQLATNEECFGNRTLSKEEIARIYGFDSRQSVYYANAGRYLGLLCKPNQATYALSSIGRQIFCSKLSTKKKNLRIVEQIFQHKVFRDCFLRYIEKAESPTNDEYMEIMRRNQLFKMSENLIPRRSSTIMNWINWILNLQST